MCSDPAAIATVSNRIDRLALDFVTRTVAAAFPTSVPAYGAMVGLGVGRTLGTLVLLDQGLPSGDGI